MMLGTRKSGLAILGGLALALGACSTEGTTTPTADPTANTGSATVGATGDGTAALERLSNSQYDSAVQELLGVAGQARSTFPSDTTAGDHFAMYFDAADSIGEQVFADPFLTSKLLTCTPSEDTACTRQIVQAFGSRAYRGPMSPDEVDALTKVATDAVALGETPVNSIKQVVKTVLASPQFLYTVAPATL
jgi:hypothetical protein